MAYTIEDLRTQFKVISAHINANKDLLIELDSALGDGDLGLTMSTGFEAAVEALEADAGEDLGKTLMQVGMAVNNKAPSTMGTLISSAILRAARVVKGKAEFDDQDCVEMAKAAVQGIKDRGKAERGDKTILDSLIPRWRPWRPAFRKAPASRRLWRMRPKRPRRVLRPQPRWFPKGQGPLLRRKVKGPQRPRRGSGHAHL